MIRSLAFSCIAAFHGIVALAQSAGTFNRTGDLTGPRQFHTATLLPNGKVLITGGISNSAELASAELYDPASRAFTATGTMTAPRWRHTATLLPNGKVLIAGGSPQAGAELYDPASGTFSVTGDMSTARRLHTATLLNDGIVLIAGGSYPYVQTAEIYDPIAGTFSATGNMSEPGADTATLLANGKVLITRSTRDFEENHADVYDPATGTFSRTGDLLDPTMGQYPLSIPGQYPTAILLTNGKVLIAGGAQGDFWAAAAQIYDPATGSFALTGRMTAGIGYWQAGVLLPEGQVLILGESNTGPGGTAELYDPLTGTFSVPFQSQSAEGHAATLLPDGAVLVTGGWVCCGHTIATAEIYHPAVKLASPHLLSLSGGPQGAILHASTQQLVSAANPVVAGEAVEIYGTGLIDGATIPPQVAIGGRLAEVLYFGTAPGYAGLDQINVRVPHGVPSGPCVPVRLDYLGRPSNEVALAVR